MVHEGGYSEFYVPLCAIAVVEALAGADPTVVDPYLEEARGMAGHALTDEPAARDRRRRGHGGRRPVAARAWPRISTGPGDPDLLGDTTA